MNRINKIILCGLLLCLFGAAGKGYGQEVKPGTVLWEFETGNDVSYSHWSSSPAIGSDGTVYVGSPVYAESNVNKVYALNGHTGAKKWEFETARAVHYSPAIGSDGTVYVGSRDNNLYALDGMTGTKIWEWEFEKGNNPLRVSSSLAIGSDGTVYVGSNANKVYALNGYTGAKKWEFETARTVSFSPAIGSDGTVYIGSFIKNLYALNPDGTKKWEFETGYDVRTSPAIGRDGTIYVGSIDTKVYALNPDGTKKWEFETGSSVISSPVIGYGGTVYVGSGDGKVYALDGMTGTKKWEFETGGEGHSSPAIGSDGTVYVGSGESKVYALDGVTGAKQWEFETGGEGHSSPAIGSDGTVYVGSWDGHLYAFATSSSGPADSPWPMSGQNAQRTGRVNVGGPIIITGQPRNTSVREGDGRTVLYTSTEGEWPRTYQWEFNGQPIQGATKHSLIIENITQKDAGRYRVTITNKHGSVTSDEAVLKVTAYGAPRISVIEDIIVEEKKTITFSPEIKGSGPITYQWKFNNQPITGADNQSLTIENVLLEDAGRYSVVATYKYGSVTSNEAILKVTIYGAPRISVGGSEVIDSVVKGDKAEITLSTPFKGGTILYTLDGSEPSFDSTLYDEPFTISKTTGIRAIAYSVDFSELAEADPVFINIVPNYDLNVSVQGQGTVVKDPPDGLYMQDSVVRLKAVPEEGWRFKGWDGALKSSFDEGSVVMVSGKSVTAKFEEIPKYNLSTLTAGVRVAH